MMERQVESPDLKEVLDDFKVSLFSELNCHSIGTIESFNIENQTASINIVYRKVINNEIYKYPLLIDCPVVVMSGGVASLRMPIVVGDTCLVFFNDRDIDNWYEGGHTATLNSDRMHSLSDGIALVGIRSLQNVITDYDPEAAELKNGDTTISLKEKIKLENDVQNLKTLVDSLIDTIIALQTIPAVVGVNLTLDATTIANLNTVKADFGGLLE